MDENTQARLDEKLKEVLALAKKKKNVLDYQQVVDSFAELSLEDDQLDKIVEYLEHNGVDVLRITDDDEPDEEMLRQRKKRLMLRISIFLFRTVSALRILSACI